MKQTDTLIKEIFDSIRMQHSVLKDPQVAHLIIEGNRVLGLQGVPGLHVIPRELPDGVAVRIVVDEGVVIEKDVHMCFGVTPATGMQRIELDVETGARSSIAVLAHCTFPNALDVTHRMEGRIRVGEGARYSYFERHVHSEMGGAKVYPHAKIELLRGASFRTEFELLRGRVGLIDMDYETDCGEDSLMEMVARISGRAEDVIRVREVGHLAAGARGVLKSKIAVRNQARADIYNILTAHGPGARGHVDCKEIVKDEAVATATPIVEVHHAKAHITHEAAIGSVDSKQLQTLMSRGLSEDEATELIIQGLLS